MISETEFKEYWELHTIYQSIVDDHISDCYCDNCLIRSTLSYIIRDNRWRFLNLGWS